MSPVYFLLAGGFFVGWALGTNDGANVFGTAVGTKVLPWRLATILIAVPAIIGAFTMGHGNLKNVRNLALLNGLASSDMTTNAIMGCLVFVASGITTFIMSYLGLPVSVNQCITGALVGWGITNSPDWTKNAPELIKFVSTWVLNPTLGCIVCLVLVLIYNATVKNWFEGHSKKDEMTKWCYIFFGVYTAFSLGVNSSANQFAFFFSDDPAFPNLLTSPRIAATFGGIAIASGVLTYSRNVMETVGESIAPLTQQEGFIVTLAVGLTVFVFGSPTIGINIPVSTSQAVVGAVAGIGISKGWRCIKFKKLGQIALAWLATPTISGVIMFIVGLLYKPSGLITA
jgi:Phosphate/sulphate permeases